MPGDGAVITVALGSTETPDGVVILSVTGVRMNNATPFPAPNSRGWWSLFALATLSTLTGALLLGVIL